MSYNANSGPFLVMSGSLMGALTSSDIGLQNQCGFSAQIYFSSSFSNGAATGSFQLQASNKPPNNLANVYHSGNQRITTWTNVTTNGSVALSGGVGAPAFFNISDVYYERARIVYTPSTPFTGSTEIWVYKKG